MSCLISSRSSSFTPSCRMSFFVWWMYLGPSALLSQAGLGS